MRPFPAPCLVMSVFLHFLLNSACGIQQETRSFLLCPARAPYQGRESEAEAKKRQEMSAKRKSQIGTGDRSEKIRTYNYPQDRLTDHRIKLTLHNLPTVLDGDLDGLISELRKADSN